MTDSQANRDKTYPVSEIPLGAMAERMGVTLLEASINRIVCQMPVEGNTQPFGLLNGGASMALAETLGSIGANLFAGPDRVAVGIDIN
ncbi:MAG: hotdog domain-containing protein, partial [Actinomycetes bacterium]